MPEPLSESSEQHLQRAEVEAALALLFKAPGGMARVKKSAQLFAQNLPGMDFKDLIQETFTLLLTGRRKWPRELPTSVVIWKAMRSIAHNARKKKGYLLADDLCPAFDENFDDAPSPLTERVSAEGDPANAFETKSELEVVQNLVKGNEDLELYVEALAEGLTGMSIAKELGWDEKKYDAVRKKFSRRLGELKKDRS